MIHEEQRMQISQYIDAELDPALEAELFTHITGCGPCREFMRYALRLRADLRKEPAVATGAALHLNTPGKWLVPKGGIASIITQYFGKRVSLSYGFSTLLACAVIILGILIGTLQQFTFEAPERDRLERVTVSVFPNVTVIGHMPVQQPQGEKQ